MKPRIYPAAVIGALSLAALAAAPAPLETIANAEREFARQAGELGIRESFDRNFADDGIIFAPEPVVRREVMAKRPRPQTPPKVTLEWYPVLNDIADSGELGYSTGPSTFTDNSEGKGKPRYGYFFSIWMRESDAPWKVALDLGTDVPEPRSSDTAAAWRGARHETYAAKSMVDLPAERAALKQREAALQQAVAAKGLPAAYAESLAADFRIHRDGHLPYVEAAAAASRLGEEQAQGALTWQPTNVGVARSADLGYTWGSYTRMGKTVEKGHYVHMWRRTASGAWRLAFEVQKPLPPPAG